MPRHKTKGERRVRCQEDLHRAWCQPRLARPRHTMHTMRGSRSSTLGPAAATCPTQVCAYELEAREYRGGARVYRAGPDQPAIRPVLRTLQEACFHLRGRSQQWKQRLLEGRVKSQRPNSRNAISDELSLAPPSPQRLRQSHLAVRRPRYAWKALPRRRNCPLCRFRPVSSETSFLIMAWTHEARHRGVR